MEKELIVQEILSYIKETNPRAKDLREILTDESIFEIGLLDSFAIVELVAFVETKWDIKIDRKSTRLNSSH